MEGIIHIIQKMWSNLSTTILHIMKRPRNMLSNQEFLDKVLISFKEFISSGTSRSTAKLKPLHGAIAADIAERLGDGYKVYSQGFGDGKEKKIDGRYIDKMVDITIENVQTKQPVAGIGVKFVMQNYSQNSNNYFENMLGETANIRTANFPYFQIFIILDKLPYYKKSGILKKWEEFTDHNMSKYCKLSADNIEVFMHTPNKTLICVAHIDPDTPVTTNQKADYMSFYTSKMDELKISYSTHNYKGLITNGTIIMNDYKSFIEKVYHTIKAI